MPTFFKKVLIVDDNKTDRWQLRKSIVNTELVEEIIEAENGMEALNMLTTIPKKERVLPDLIFLDLDMPVLSGMEFLNAFGQVMNLRENNCRIIITCSDYDYAEKKLVYNHHFVVGYFQKPLNENIILQLKDQMRHSNVS